MRLAPFPPPEVARPLEHVLAGAAAATGAAPEVVLVEDPAEAWLLEACALTPAERARSVVAARTEEAMLAAARLGISGALWLPPSTMTATAALRYAASSSPPRVADPALTDLASRAGGLLLVVVANPAFWRCQAGEPALASCLVDLAAELAVPPALVPGPALVVGGCADQRIEDLWERVTAARGLETQGIRRIPITGPVGHCGVAVAAARAMAREGEGVGETAAGKCRPQPVRQLPSGRRVGWWSPRAEPTAMGAEWHASPATANAAGFEWRMRAAGDAWVVPDVVRSADVAPPAARVPGWVGAAAAAGSPAGLLVERLANTAQRVECPLWLPGVAASALRFALSLPGEIWIDGPAVPGGGSD